MSSGFQIKPKANYSALFQTLPGNSGANLNFLSDYASIKNGSYGKLMKAYYAKPGSKEATANDIKSSVSTAKDSAKTLAGVEKAADGLKDSADKLITTGSKSVFSKKNVTTKDEAGYETTTKQYDTEAIYKAVSKFVDDYNSLMNKTEDINAKSVLNRTASLVKMTAANEKLLSDVGISIKKDNTLSIDKSTFEKANMSTVKSLFNGNSSYAYRTSAQASLIGFAADTEASKSNTYTGSGSFSNNFSSGNIIDSLF